MKGLSIACQSNELWKTFVVSVKVTNVDLKVGSMDPIYLSQVGPARGLTLDAVFFILKRCNFV